jgi:arylsulfatase A-like enzyme
MVETVDLMPTVLDWCGVPVPAGVQGQSLLPLIRGDAGATGRESVLIQERQAPDLAARGLDPAAVTQWGIRTRDWKLIHYPACPYGELYDLRQDPGEFGNLWADPGYRSVRGDLGCLLLDRLALTQDPLPARHCDW